MYIFREEERAIEKKVEKIQMLKMIASSPLYREYHWKDEVTLQREIKKEEHNLAQMMKKFHSTYTPNNCYKESDEEET